MPLGAGWSCRDRWCVGSADAKWQLNWTPQKKKCIWIELMLNLWQSTGCGGLHPFKLWRMYVYFFYLVLDLLAFSLSALRWKFFKTKHYYADPTQQKMSKYQAKYGGWVGVSNPKPKVWGTKLAGSKVWSFLFLSRCRLTRRPILTWKWQQAGDS